MCQSVNNGIPDRTGKGDRIIEKGKKRENNIVFLTVQLR
jgi:hypothetical protein